VSKLSDQIRQEYREAVACAVEGKDDIQAWGKVYQSLSQAIFSAWLSSVADNTEGIEECEVAKLIFAKSDCGAGKDDAPGFQEGNTCAGEGGGGSDERYKSMSPKELASEAVRLQESGMPLSEIVKKMLLGEMPKAKVNEVNDEWKKLRPPPQPPTTDYTYPAMDYQERYRLAQQFSIKLDKPKPNYLALKKSVDLLANFEIKNDRSFAKDHSPMPDRVYQQDSFSRKASIGLYQELERFFSLSEKEQEQEIGVLMGKADSFVESVYLVANNSEYESHYQGGMEDFEYKIDGVATGVIITSKSKEFKSTKEYVENRLKLRDAGEAEIRVAVDYDTSRESSIKKAKKFMNKVVQVRQMLIDQGVQIPNLELSYDENNSAFSSASVMGTAVTRTVGSISRDEHFFSFPITFNGSGDFIENSKELDKRGNYLVTSKNKKEDGIEGVLLHEIGHQLHYANLVNQRIDKMYGGFNSLLEKQNSMETTKAFELPAHSMWDEIFRSLTDLEAKQRSGKEHAWDLSSDMKHAPDWWDYVKDNVSTYATTNYNEFVAEVFTGQMIGVEFDDIIMDYYKVMGGPEVGKKTL
jgi:hypothetical protein